MTLSWDARSEIPGASYSVYWGSASGSYTNAQWTSDTNFTFNGVDGATYYFAVTTYDANGNQSGYSSEVAYTFTNGQAVQVQAVPISGFTMTRRGTSFWPDGTSGVQYIIQASSNLVNWISLQTNTAPFTFVDSNSSQFSKRFYRAIQAQ